MTDLPEPVPTDVPGAVDVDAIAWSGDFVLDRSYRFLSVATLPPITADIQALVGASVWDVFGGQDLLEPAADRVLEAQRPAGMRVFFDGIVQDLHAAPHGRFLRIRYKVIREIDVSTLDTLLASVRAVAADLARPFGAPPFETA